MKKTLLITALIFGFGVLQFRLWFGDASIPHLIQLSRTISVEQASLAKLADRNQKMDIEVQALKGSHEALEEQARLELGMIKKGETFYQVSDPNPDQNSQIDR